MNFKDFQAAAGISNEVATRWYIPLTDAMHEFNILTPTARAMLIAQIGHESDSFTKVVESFNYSVRSLKKTFSTRVTDEQAKMLGRSETQQAKQREIANLVYGGRNGNNRDDDGWKYRGRGLIQITFYNNYINCSHALGADFISEPILLERDSYAARSACWVWNSFECYKCSEDIVKVTKLINGGSNGLSDRIARFNRAVEVLIRM
ncbi:glycoside hydrolase family 19 protein [Salmonella enterica subsp. enterica serovar Montevideo]|nr:glycoside hydrolase family 19 protein [Salmonella enterica]EDM3454284.1 glycoside hydrolase family 19 protein [Salmonella enterica subsp. enterica serovar Montevideo]ECR9187480.1 glycoside hydrolase family 19 protein [Salmonella enterica]EEN9822032.1 glycoside hydrolase family 19 protein [Salmonella enterica]EFS8829869.1 glycoside hydrolase family 19 protein [Salmonella enterica]